MKYKFVPAAMIAIDCEKVQCEDRTEALVKVCVADHNLKVKLHTFVKPDKAILDYRTEITGVTSQNLQTVTCSLADIQAVLGRKVRENGASHDCEDDARAAMELAQVMIKHGVDKPFPYTDVQKHAFRSGQGDKYAAVAIFKNQEKANDAFANVQGIQVQIVGSYDILISTCQEIAKK